MSGLYRLWRAKHNPPPDPSHVSFHGKTILITGATSGIGFEASLKFLRQGCSTLIIGSRDLDRGEKVKNILESCTGRIGVIQVFALDMSSFQGVSEFVSRVTSTTPNHRPLDIVVLNAGIMRRDYVLSPDGWEDTLQVNTLSTAMLAELLLPKLHASSSTTGETNTSHTTPHLVIVSSGTALRVSSKHLLTPTPPLPSSISRRPLLNYLNQPATRKKYAISKLLIEYIAQRIAKYLLTPSGQLDIIVTTVKPGLCASSLSRQYTAHWTGRWAVAVFNYLFARTAEAGSRAVVSACVQGYECHGKMWDGEKVQE